jgi:ribosomal protein L6P/L9E
MHRPAHRILTLLVVGFFCAVAWAAPVLAAEPAPDYRVEVSKKGLGKEALITKGDKEWFMMIEVTPENTVIIRQEKHKDVFVVDESETHDRAMTADEVNAAIDAFVTGVTSQGKLKKP